MKACCRDRSVRLNDPQISVFEQLSALNQEQKLSKRYHPYDHRTGTVGK
jgi:hypothetical protein